MTKLTNKLKEYVEGCFTAIWIQSHEPQEAIADIRTLCSNQQWQLATWDIDRGLRAGSEESETTTASDPLAAVKAATSMNSSAVNNESPSIVVLENYHRYLGSAEIVQALATQTHAGKQTRSIIVILAPVVELPPELEKLFVVVEHALPDAEQLEAIARQIATEQGELPGEGDLATVLDAAAGLTRLEAENAFSLSLVRHGKLTPETIWELKVQALRKSGLELYRGDASFAGLGGLDALKSFCKRALTRSTDSLTAKGVMLLSPPGCGKSQICKALGNETGRPVILLDVGSLMGSLVGQTEQRTRQALKIIDAMGKSVVLLDEADKALGGATGGGAGDSGVSARMFGTLLTWLNDRQSDSFVVCTANDVQKLPPEFARAERFDSVFFVDLPSADERQMIWDQYIGLYELDPNQTKPKDASWTGAEIKACCRLAALLDVPLKHAALNVVPVAATAQESIDRLRKWAGGRCIDAQKGGIYSSSNGKKPKSRRKVKTSPSLN